MARVLPHPRVDDSGIDRSEVDDVDKPDVDKLDVDTPDVDRFEVDESHPAAADGVVAEAVDVAAEQRAEAQVGPVDAESAAKIEPTLTDLQRSIIVFERQWWRHAGSKEQAIREQFGLSATRYYQMLNQLLDRPEALAFDPVTVGRLRRLRATRSRTRTAR